MIIGVYGVQGLLVVCSRVFRCAGLGWFREAQLKHSA